MANTTTVTFVRAANKAHRCDWCDQRIEAGEEYRRYRWFEGGDAGTCKMHPECFIAMQSMPKQYLHDLGFSPGDHPRGCWCDHEPDCPQCHPELSKSDGAISVKDGEAKEPGGMGPSGA